jgi:hypothetical protein
MTDHDQLLALSDKLRRSGRVRVDGSLAYALADALRAALATRPEPHAQPRNLAGEVTPWPWEHPDTSEVWDWAYREGYRAASTEARVGRPEPGPE